MLLNKETYTKIFLKQSNIAISPVTIKQYLPKWWKNTRTKETGGLRLTDEGLNHLKDVLELRFFDVHLPRDFVFNTQTIIYIDQFIDCPYYLDGLCISVTDEKKYLELTLLSGDIQKYGLTKAMTRKTKISEYPPDYD
jgi:hypothetical protein